MTSSLIGKPLNEVFEKYKDVTEGSCTLIDKTVCCIHKEGSFFNLPLDNRVENYWISKTVWGESKFEKNYRYLGYLPKEYFYNGEN